MLLSHGIDCLGRIVGFTKQDFGSKENRSQEIKQILLENPIIDKYLILDDEDLGFSKDNLNFYKTDSLKGLVLEDIQAIIDKLKE